MTRDSWFRNTEWNESIATTFEQKLRRARDKSQYLRIQACMLAKTHPRVALELLDRYFALGEHFDMAQAYVDRAVAHLALGNLDAAIESYEAALLRERGFPNVRTTAGLDLPYLIALNEMSERYVQALSMLSGSTETFLFPVERFKHHAARAMILRGIDREAARSEARQALEAAALDHSGLRYHPDIGLVSDCHTPALSRLRELCNA